MESAVAGCASVDGWRIYNIIAKKQPILIEFTHGSISSKEKKLGVRAICLAFPVTNVT
jgi:hypothetical protein